MTRFTKAEPKVELTHVIFRNIVLVVLTVFTLVIGCEKDKNTVSTTTEQKAVAAPTNKEITIPLLGEIGASSRWGSGWLDLGAPTDFLNGDRIRIKVGGSAAKILVRLLPKGQSPDTGTGRIGGTITVPENRIVEVTLKYDREDVIQVSVHGGAKPWNISLGGGNGPATIEEAEVIRIVTQ